jgi:ATP synthase subunit 6
MISPLEQFNVVNYTLLQGPLTLHNIHFYLLTNVNLTVLLITIVVLFVCVFLFSSLSLIFNLILLLFSYYYSFCVTLLKENFTRRGLYFFPYVFSLFNILLLANLFGMVPYSFALTSHLVVTLFLSALTFVSSVILCIRLHGWHFFSLFLPAGSPFLLMPFLVILELISFSARLFSLAIRLFANIMSGHTLLKILASFVWLLLIKTSLLFAIPFLVIFTVSFLEIGIAMLQAYVFAVLSCIYLNEAIILH